VGLNAVNALKTLGMTCDSSLNTYSAGKPIPASITAQGGKRLDYIFYREGRDAKYAVHCLQSEVVLDELVPGEAFSYSDHFGLTSTFKFERHASGASGSASVSEHQRLISTSPSAKSVSTADPLVGAAEDSRPPSPTSAYELLRHPSSGSAASAIRTALGTLRDYTLIAGRRTQLYNVICAACIVAMVALAVGSAWQPKSWIQPIFTVVAFVFGAAGATYLYWGWLWGRWERGALDETVAEMELALNRLSGQR
jgi:sphingomyelin phosphodiesterase 2